MRFEIVLAPEAIQDLKRLRAHDRAVVRDAFGTRLRRQPAKTGKSRIKRLRGISRPQFRLRAGEVRVYYDVTESTVNVLAIVPKSMAVGWLKEMGEEK